MSNRTRFSSKERLALFLQANGSCAKCFLKIRPGKPWDIDHIVPLALGGTNDNENLQVLCSACHTQKTKVDVSTHAKARRVQARHLGASRSKRPMPCGRQSPFKKTVDGRVVRR